MIVMTNDSMIDNTNEILPLTTPTFARHITCREHGDTKGTAMDSGR